MSGQERIRELKPCPFCGAGESYFKVNNFWTGMRNAILSVEIIHHCEEKPTQNMLQIRGATEDHVIAKWNERYPR